MRYATNDRRHWLIDVVAPDRRMAAALVAGFGALVNGGELNLHPLIARLVDKDVLDRLGARRRGADMGAGASA